MQSVSTEIAPLVALVSLVATRYQHALNPSRRMMSELRPASVTGCDRPDRQQMNYMSMNCYTTLQHTSQRYRVAPPHSPAPNSEP
jgi:hypothetical protein